MRLPRVKGVHRPYRTNGAIRIGGAAFGVAAEIADPDGVVWSLLTAMDGTRTPAQIAAAVRADRPHLPEPALVGAIDQLVATGFLEDAATAEDPAAGERYSRSTAYYSYVDRTPRASMTEVPHLIAAAHVTVLGVGGVGSTAAHALAASGVGGLTLIDPDVVELSNLNRQLLFTTKDIGRPKVDAAAERLTELRPDLAVDVRHSALTSAAEIADLFAESQVVLLCADTPAEIEQWCNTAALTTTTPWVSGAYDGPHVCVTRYDPPHGPCWRCLRLQHYDRDPLPGETTPHMATAATTGLAGNLTAHVALAQITGIAPPPAGVPVVWNAVALGHAFAVPVHPDPSCPDCAHRS